MSLYFVYSLDIKSRKVGSIFFFEDNRCFLTHSDKATIDYFDYKRIDVNAYKQIVDFAEKKKLSAYEIMLSGRESLEEIIKFLSDYLFSRDLSIGLLTTSRGIIDTNYDLLKSYGVTVVNPFLARSFQINSALSSGETLGSFESSFKIIGKPHVEPICTGAAKSSKPKKKTNAKLANIGTIELEESFHDKFIKLLIESGKDNVEVYKKAGITRQVFSKIYSDKNVIPQKLTLISLCIGLELPLKTAKELMVSAGYSLSKSIMLDSVVMKYLREEIYDFELINSELNEYGCQLLGWHPRDN